MEERAPAAIFRKRPPLLLRFLLLATLSVALMALDYRFEPMRHVRAWFDAALLPLVYIANFPVAATDWVARNVAPRDALLAKNAELLRENLLLQQRIQRYAGLEAENIRLRRLLDSYHRLESERILVAETISINPDPNRHEIRINRGTRDGVYVGQPLLDAHGVMGQVVRITPFSSAALLISDLRHAIPVQVNRNGLRAIAAGAGRYGRLNLLYIPPDADIRIGDELVTSGMGLRFPPGYPVGAVETVVQIPGEEYAQATARPAAALDRAREALLVWPPSAPVETNAAAATSATSATPAMSKAPEAPAAEAAPQ